MKIAGGIAYALAALADAAPGRSPNVGFIFMRMVFIMAMIRGARAMSQLAPARRRAV